MTTKAVLLHAIRGKCLDCSAFQPGEVRECPVTACGLWPYRFGRDPDPGPARGCAKPSLGRSGANGERAAPVSCSGPVAESRELPLPRGDSGQGEAVQGQGLARHGARASAPVRA